MGDIYTDVCNELSLKDLEEGTGPVFEGIVRSKLNQLADSMDEEVNIMASVNTLSGPKSPDQYPLMNRLEELVQKLADERTRTENLLTPIIGSSTPAVQSIPEPDSINDLDRLLYRLQYQISILQELNSRITL